MFGKRLHILEHLHASAWLQKGGMLASVVLAAALGSCSIFPQDPVHEAAVSAMGDEPTRWTTGEELPPSVAESQYHRAGQPCLVCHANQGPADLRFAVAGTVFWGRCDCKPGAPPNQGGCDKAKGKTCDQTPVEGAEVRIFDSSSRSRCFRTNCAGNFMVPSSDPLQFPLLVSVYKVAGQERILRSMGGHIGREGSCAGCHKNPTYQDSPGQIRLYDDNTKIPPYAKPRACPPVQNPQPPFARCEF